MNKDSDSNRGERVREKVRRQDREITEKREERKRAREKRERERKKS